MSERQVAAADRVPMVTRVGWGFGGIADGFMVSVMFALGLVIYTTAFKMPPEIAGLALFIPRLMDAITDPWIGNLSDNFRSKWGRRRPLMLVGVVGAAVLLPLMWYPPALETINNPWYSNGPFWYLAAIGSLYFVFYTLFMVPYTALGFELTDDYDERTRVISWRMYLGLAASMIYPSLYWMCRQFGSEVDGQWVPDEIMGARIVCLGLAVVIIVTGLIPVLTTREREDVERQETIPIFKALAATMTNKPFLILLVGYIAVNVGINLAGTVGPFVLIYFVFRHLENVDLAKDAAGALGSVIGIVAAMAAYISLYLISGVSRKTSKKTAMVVGLALMLTGVISMWFFYRPPFVFGIWGTSIPALAVLGAAWMLGNIGWNLSTETGRRVVYAAGGVLVAGLIGAAMYFMGSIKAPIFSVQDSWVFGVLVATVIVGLGGQGCWLMIDSMTADVCDEDEVETGLRREGMFGAVQGFARKIAFALTVLFGGYILKWVGFNAEQAEAAGGASEVVAERMLNVYILCQGGGLVISLLLFTLYPITRRRAAATRKLLDERLAQVQADLRQTDQ